MKRNKNIAEININMLYVDHLNYQNVNEYFGILEKLLLGHPKLKRLHFDGKNDSDFTGNEEKERSMMTRNLKLKNLTTSSPYLTHLEMDSVVRGSRTRYDDACFSY